MSLAKPLNPQDRSLGNIIYLDEFTLGAMTLTDINSALDTVTGNAVVTNAIASPVTNLIEEGIGFYHEFQDFNGNFTDLTFHLYMENIVIPTPVGVGKCGVYMVVASKTAGVVTKWSALGITRDNTGLYYRSNVAQGAVVSESAFGALEVPAKMHWDIPLQSNNVMRGGPYATWDASDVAYTGAGIGAQLSFVSGLTTLHAGLVVINENAEVINIGGKLHMILLQKPTIVPGGV